MLDLKEIREKASEEISELKVLFDDGLQLSDIIQISEKVTKGIGKICLVAQNMKEFSGEGQGIFKRKYVVKFIDDLIKLPMPLELIDGFIINKFIEAAVNTGKKHGWDLEFFD